MLPNSKFILIAVAFLHCSNAFSIASRIYRGTISEREQFPYYVQVERYYDENYAKGCGGSLISNEWILTAAHCVNGGKYIMAHLGMHETRAISEPGRVLQVIMKRNIFIHPDYRHTNVLDDIALIKLSKPVQFSAFIQPVNISKDIELELGDDVIAIGNGASEMGGDMSKYLRWIPLKIVSDHACKALFPRIRGRDTVLCAGNGEQSVGFGDSGGSLVRKDDNTLVGISSFIHSSTSLVEGKGVVLPQAFTHVAYYLDWIQSVTKLTF